MHFSQFDPFFPYWYVPVEAAGSKLIMNGTEALAKLGLNRKALCEHAP